ncbi:FimV/HubP family polar landmark protein [Psychrobacter faecalis]|nr:FimV/HubP family polar landmark protein [Psychrobacter faecalis]
MQLGEYDSAKRLLIEVINQGNSEQQSQAQALLDRTA